RANPVAKIAPVQREIGIGCIRADVAAFRFLATTAAHTHQHSVHTPTPRYIKNRPAAHRNAPRATGPVTPLYKTRAIDCQRKSSPRFSVREAGKGIKARFTIREVYDSAGA